MISRGQIYFVNLSPTQGREQAGRRPVLVVSVDAINRQPLVIAVVAGTEAKNVPRDYPTNVRVTAKETGLPIDTVFLCFQLRSLDPARFYDPKTLRPNLAGILPPGRMAEVDNALRLVLGMEASMPRWRLEQCCGAEYQPSSAQPQESLERQNRKTLRRLKASGEKAVTIKLKATKHKVSKVG